MYEPKLVKEQEVRKSWSQISLEERKTKKLSQKNSAKKKALSVAATEATSWQQTKEETPRVLKKREGCFFFSFFSVHFINGCYILIIKQKPPLLSTVILIDGKKIIPVCLLLFSSTARAPNYYLHFKRLPVSSTARDHSVDCAGDACATYAISGIQGYEEIHGQWTNEQKSYRFGKACLYVC